MVAAVIEVGGWWQHQSRARQDPPPPYLCLLYCALVEVAAHSN